MTDLFEPHIEWNRKEISASGDRLFSLGTKIATWLLIGNAAAATLSLNAILDKKICDPVAAQPVVWSFVWGMGAAFVGVAINYFSGYFGMLHLSQILKQTTKMQAASYYIQKLEDEGFAVAQDSTLQTNLDNAGAELQRLERRVWLFYIGLFASVAFFSLSAVSFMYGITRPLSDHFSAAICTANTPPLAMSGTPPAAPAAKSASDRSAATAIPASQAP